MQLKYCFSCTRSACSYTFWCW